MSQQDSMRAMFGLIMVGGLVGAIGCGGGNRDARAAAPPSNTPMPGTTSAIVRDTTAPIVVIGASVPFVPNDDSTPSAPPPR